MPEIRTEQPGTISALNDTGDVIVRAQRHEQHRKWSVLVNTSPRQLPDMTCTGNETTVRSLVQLLADGITARGWQPTHLPDR